jgi:hypothetical protein
MAAKDTHILPQLPAAPLICVKGGERRWAWP